VIRFDPSWWMSSTCVSSLRLFSFSWQFVNESKVFRSSCRNPLRQLQKTKMACLPESLEKPAHYASVRFLLV
jgi:hypothetical protein